jgi:hypothetical protein
MLKAAILEKEMITGTASDVVLNTMTANDKIDSKVWIGNSGASCHYCNSKEGLYN